MSEARPQSSAGALGVHGLRRFWAQKTASRAGGNPHPSSADDLRTDNVLLAGLRLGLRETLDFLIRGSPSFEEFEAWVLTKNAGAMEPARVERLNGALRRDATFALETTLAEPVLSAADLAFWDDHGYIVVKNAVSAAACRAAVEAILSYAEMSLDRPDSWYKSALWIPLAHHSALWANRNSPLIHTAFAQVWRRSDLWMNVDVCGVNPPVRPGYSFQGTPLHWDMTLAPPHRFRYAGHTVPDRYRGQSRRVQLRAGLSPAACSMAEGTAGGRRSPSHRAKKAAGDPDRR